MVWGLNLWRDPIVEETRKDADKLAANVDDKNRFIENIRKNQLTSKECLVSS
jgi:cobalamin biosynthesis protein CobT